MNDQIDISSVATRLRPIFDKAKEGGASVIGDVGSDLSDKATSSISGLILDLFKSAGKSVWAKRRSKRAWKTFREHYQTAETAGDREKAIRKLLEDDPKYAVVFRNLLSKRDLVYAMREYAEHLPSIPMLGSKRTLSDCYVATGLARATSSDHSKTPASELGAVGDQIKVLLARGNHLIEGNPGSGKSTLARRIVTLETNRLLSDPTLVSFDNERIPILVHADQLASSENDLPTALCSALTKELSFSITGRLQPDLFSPYSANGHRKWLLVIDSLEEIPDPVRRQKFWDRLELLPEQLGETFRFVVFSRPETIKKTKQSDTLRWQLPAMSAAERRQLLRQYIDGEHQRNSFVELIKTTGLSELFSYPLFCAIGASLFVENQTIPGTKIELCETFIHLLLENRETLRGSDRRSLLKLLKIVSSTDFSREQLTPSDFGKLLPKGTPHLVAIERLQELLVGTGLVRASGNKYAFVHDIFRSYFAAHTLAETSEPNKDAWKSIDPYTEGWSTVEFVAKIWDLAGKDVSSAANALLSFGDLGVRSAAEIYRTCNTVEDKLAESIMERVFREMFSTGVSIWHTDVLSKLAEKSAAVRSTLHNRAMLGPYMFGARVECARCLLRAGDTQMAIDALQYIGEGELQDDWDRIDAAKILCEIGDIETGLPILQLMTTKAEEFDMRLDAVLGVLEFSRPAETSNMLTSLINGSPEDREEVSLNNIERLIKLKENEIALDLLREKTKPENFKKERSSIFNEAVGACELITIHFNYQEGIAKLQELVDSDRVSDQVKISALNTMIELGAPDHAAEKLIKLRPQLQDEYGHANWGWLGIFSALGQQEIGGSFAVDLLKFALERGSRSYDLGYHIEDLSHFIPADQITESIQEVVEEAPEPHLVTSLALIGKRDVALRYLQSWRSQNSVDLQVRCSVELYRLGEPELGRKKLEQISRNRELPFSIRLKAAEGLSHAGDTTAANKVYKHLMSSKSLSVSERCEAARYFGEEGVSQPDLISNALQPLLVDENLSIRDRCEVAKRLLHTADDDGWSPISHWDVCETLVDMLENQIGTATEAWIIVDTLSNVQFEFSGIPYAAELAQNPEIPVAERVSVLRSLYVRSDEQEIIAPLLLKISQEQDASLAEKIEALWPIRDDVSEAKSALAAMLADNRLPPKWRLAATKGLSIFSKPSTSGSSEVIINDPSVSIAERLRELKNFISVSTIDADASLLQNIASTSDLSCEEQLAIAKAAIDFKKTELATELIKQAEQAKPLSLYELVELISLHQQIGNSTEALRCAKELSEWPDIVLAELEDDWAVVDAAQAMAALNQSTMATTFLQRYLTNTTWDAVPKVLDAIAEIAGEDIRTQAAMTVVEDLTESIQDEEPAYRGGLWRAAEYFIVHKWLTDLAPLETVATKNTRTLFDRVGAAGALYFGAIILRDSHHRTVAQQALDSLAKEGELSAGDALFLVPALKRCGLGALTEEIIDKIANRHPATVDERRQIASFLRENGRYDEAAKLLEAVSLDDDASAGLGVLHQDIIKQVQGKARHRAILTQQVFSPDRLLFDRLIDARELISEYGDQRALQLILDTAEDQNEAGDTRLEAVIALEELGFRELPLSLMQDIEKSPNLDEYWMGDTFLRLGNKPQAEEHLKRSITTSPSTYRDQIARTLATLNDADAILLLNERFPEPGRTPPGLVARQID